MNRHLPVTTEALFSSPPGADTQAGACRPPPPPPPALTARLLCEHARLTPSEVHELRRPATTAPAP